MNIVRLFLPDPEHLIGTAFDWGFSKGNSRKLLRQVIAVDHTELLNCIGTRAILPVRADFFTLCAYTVFQYILTHINKNLICFAHLNNHAFLSACKHRVADTFRYLLRFVASDYCN